MNDAIVTEAKPRLLSMLLQHSLPDHEVSKPSSDSHLVSNLYLAKAPGWVSAFGSGDRVLKAPLEWRVCQVCNTDFVEDELHFVMVCNKLEHERNKLLYYITQKDLSFMHLNKPF